MGMGRCVEHCDKPHESENRAHKKQRLVFPGSEQRAAGSEYDCQTHEKAHDISEKNLLHQRDCAA